MPYAFMTAGGSEPRHTTKSETVTIFEEEAIRASGVDRFMFDGYPISRGDFFALAVDGMNFIQSQVDRSYSLTVGIHANKLARRIVNNTCRSVREFLFSLDVHFDDPERVPLAKSGEQSRRDANRTAKDARASMSTGTIMETENYETQLGSNIAHLNLNSAPPKE